MRGLGGVLVAIGGILMVVSLLALAPYGLVLYEQFRGLAIVDPATGTDPVLERAVLLGRAAATAGACGIAIALACLGGGIALLRRRRSER